jgi:hypothetical protein
LAVEATTISAVAACCSAVASAVASMVALRSLRQTQRERERDRRRQQAKALSEVRAALDGLRQGLLQREYGTPAWQGRLRLLSLAVLMAEEELSATSLVATLARPPTEDDLQGAGHEVEAAIGAAGAAGSGRAARRGQAQLARGQSP